MTESYNELSLKCILKYLSLLFLFLCKLELFLSKVFLSHYMTLLRRLPIWKMSHNKLPSNSDKGDKENQVHLSILASFKSESDGN